MLEDRMQGLLGRRKANQAFRRLVRAGELLDFSSNDYLSLARNEELCQAIHEKSKYLKLGATGSRLLSGHYELLEELEGFLADFHRAETALVFNSGYNANLSLLASLPRRGDVILYDALIHASLHDGIRLGKADALKFGHNNLETLEQLLIINQGKISFVVVESVYSMDGDEAPLLEMVALCQKYKAYLIVDEAHSTGIFGNKGEGLCCALGIEKQIFARVHTFGKAIGCHGAAVAGSQLLRDYLINYARPLIYTTAMSPHTVLAVLESYKILVEHGRQWITELQAKIQLFNTNIAKTTVRFIDSNSPIQTIIIPTNERVSQKAIQLQKLGYDIRPICSPTVPRGEERLRICLHLHNTKEDISTLVNFFKD